MSHDDASTQRDHPSVTRHEEELLISKQPTEVGRLRVHTHVDTTLVTEHVETQTEHFDDLERVPVAENDSGEIETLPDGSISIPVFEEQLVITKRLVVRERVIIHKRTVTEQHCVEAELREERVTVEGDIAPPQEDSRA